MADPRVRVVTTPQCPWNPWLVTRVRRLAGDETVEEVDYARVSGLLADTGAGYDQHLFCLVLVDGKALPGDPAQPGFAAELLAALGKPLPPPGIPAGQPPGRPGGPLSIRPLDAGGVDLAITLCLRHHPSGEVVPEEAANAGRKAKAAYLQEVLAALGLAGYLAVDERAGLPAGILELAPRPLAARCGFITGRGEGPAVTVTCLEAGRGRDRPVVERALVAHLAANREAFRPHAAVEVGAFPGEHGFPPAAVFLAAGFTPVEHRGRAVVLRLGIPRGSEG